MISHFVKKKIGSLISVVLLGSFFLLSACSTVQIGRDFDVESFDKISSMADMSKAQVKELLGAPESTGVAMEKGGERLVEWVYFFGTGQLPSMSDTRIKMLQIRFEKTGMVRSYNWSNSK